LDGRARSEIGASCPGKGPQGRPRSHAGGRGQLLLAAAAAVGVGDEPDKPASAAGREKEMDRWPFASTAEPGLPRTQPSAILAGGRSRTWRPLPSGRLEQPHPPWRRARVGRLRWTCRPARGRLRRPRLQPPPGTSRRLARLLRPRCRPGPGMLLRRRLRRCGGLIQRRLVRPGARPRKHRLRPGARPRKHRLRPGVTPPSRLPEPGDLLPRARPRVGTRPRPPRRPLPRLDSPIPAAPVGLPRWAVLPRLSLPWLGLHRPRHLLSRFPTT